MSVELDAIRVATAMFADDGYTAEDVSRKRGHNGYDLLLERGGTTVTVEVKGCTRPWQIPDPYVTEFDADKRLVADYLCVVYLMDPDHPAACVIPRDAIPPKMVLPKRGYRISGSFKTERSLRPYWRSIGEHAPARPDA